MKSVHLSILASLISLISILVYFSTLSAETLKVKENLSKHSFAYRQLYKRSESKVTVTSPHIYHI
ncbi:hypothetical protein DID76_01785 [Candidatus Marinamargulisbacteria bacterium SCGC AG-414-C22]|nr:hypothetical protein DID76_01785 [Candidatus Marinamargulisbacteria bacterium SCGC AG-414-C22]